LRKVLEHHHVYGGGLRWFVLHDNQIELRTPMRGGASQYRFRLWSLCRLAAQCGALRNMPRALIGDFESDEDETTEGTNE
jgi:hypothetical protein